VGGRAHYTLRRNARSALVLGAAVLSHWLLEFILHRPDLQLHPGSEARVGLGLWNSWAASIAMEVLFFGTGLGIYLSGTRARANTGRYGFWAVIAFLFFGWVSSLISRRPPNVAALAWGGLAMGLTAPWAGGQTVIASLSRSLSKLPSFCLSHCAPAFRSPLPS
jgi:hypothetical protein